jgi:surface polysaccharide O-acyltransferase-like enzyme
MMNQQRIVGFDVARSLAIFGMIVVHFMLVMTDGMPSEKME